LVFEFCEIAGWLFVVGGGDGDVEEAEMDGELGAVAAMGMRLGTN